MSMGTRENMFSELLELVKSWFPRRSEPAYVSRDFWMPDNCCRVCYDCDVQFTIFVRKHHCRLCGRVFCGKCTANSIPVPSADPKYRKSERDRVRVCNFCLQQWQHEVAAATNATWMSSSGMDHSFSTVSSGTSGSPKSSSMSAGSMSYSNEPFQQVSYGSVPSPIPSEIIEHGANKQDVLMLGMHVDIAADLGDTCSNYFSCSLNRSDYYDDMNGVCHSDSEAHHFQYCDDYYGRVEYDDLDHKYDINKVNHADEHHASDTVPSPVGDCTKSQDSTYFDKVAEVEPEHGNDYSISSSIYGMECVVEPVDFENNGLLWLPPEPEDEEDETEACPTDDEDEYAVGEWGYLRSSKSFGSGESRSRDQSSDEQRRALKSVVGGHFRALIAQLLQVENLPIGEEGDKESWLEIITSLSWEAATLLKPDTSRGGGMDPGGYVKVKYVACGHPSQSVVVRGVVCKKNVAHRHMMSNIDNPCLLILGGALEYQRVMNLSSFDTLLQQEMDHLKMAVARIDSQHPHVLLVEKSVSRFAQDYLLAKDISVVLNVKRSLLQRISRCTGAQIVPSIDHLSSPRLGHCDLFHVEKFLEEHGSAGKDGKKLTKTLMFFEECPRPLGCTILLKGANGDELKKVKRLVKYGIFAAYHLALETSFLADEGASLPELPLESPITVALPDIPSCIDRSIFTVHGFANNASDTTVLCNNGINVNSALYTSKMTKTEKGDLHLSHSSSVSSFSTDPGDNERLHMWNFSQAMQAIEPQSRASLIVKGGACTYPNDFPGKFPSEKDNICFGESPITETISNDVQKHTILKPVTSEDDIKKENQAGISDVVNAYQDNGQLQESTQAKEAFSPSPSDHQSILVSLSSRCVWKGTVCERSHLFRIKYYGSFDKPLGRFLRDHLFDQCYRCPSCDMPSEAHIHCYTHQQGSLTISVRKLPEFHLNGEQDGRIWMWHRCLRCPRVNGFPPSTRRIVMSDAAWGLSFGKFLELSFSNHAAASRVASCGHSLHRDCLRFYGLGKMVACFRYASINVHSVCLPSHKLDFNYEYQDWVQEEAKEVDEMKKLLFTEVLSLLGQIAVKNGFNHYIHKLEEMQQKEKEEFEESLNKLLKKEVKKGEPVIDILEISKLKRQLVFQSYIWDQRLICATGCKYRPHEFLCGLLITDNEKFSQTERLDVALKVRTTIVRTNTSGSISRVDETINDGILESHIEEPFDQPKYWDLYQQKTVAEVETSDEKQNKTSLSTCASEVTQLDPLVSGLIDRRTLSDGQFPVLTNISDTFDAKWRGENGHIFSNLGMLDSSASGDPAVVAFKDTEEKGVVDVTQSSAFVFLGKLRDSTEEFSSWIGIPFHILYHFFNKSLENTPRFGALNKYNPVYVSFFRELERLGGRRSLLPIGENEVVIPVYADEPTSVICYSLVSADYYFRMSEDQEKTRDYNDSSLHSSLSGSVNLHCSHSIDEVSSEVFKSFGSTEENLFPLSGRSSLDPVSYTKSMHARISFEDDGPLGKVKYTVICYFAKHFDALRRICCPSELDFIRSLSRCKKWGAHGGKSNVFFAKSLDDRFIIKQVTKTEIESFIKFAPEYFKYLSESIATRSPTCLAKILGIYQVTIKHLKGGKDTKMDILVMENLLFGRTITRLYDLKGSSRSRYNPDSKGNNKVLLDQNLIEAMPTSPIFVDNKAKRLLERAVWNDTSFLASVDVMDYSLLVGVDEVKNELVVGIIDFMRQYTWDKHLETWVKASGILGGPKNVSPTVISPKQYKKRFRKAMSAYFLVVPDQWSSPPTEPTSLLSDLDEGSDQFTLRS